MPLVRVRRVLPSLLILAGSFAKSAAGDPARETAASTQTFPTLTAEALDRTPVTLPRQFEGRENLIFLFWARDQQAQVDTWTATAQALQHTSFDFRVYRMLVSATENALYRWWDNNSLRSAETDPELLHWTVPLYTDKIELRRALGIADDEHAIAVVLLDRSGRVLWKARGASTEAGRAGLLAAAQVR